MGLGAEVRVDFAAHPPGVRAAPELADRPRAGLAIRIRLSANKVSLPSSAKGSGSASWRSL